MSKYDSIRFYDDSEVNSALLSVSKHPAFREMIRYTFPDKTEEEIAALYSDIHSIYDFQTKVAYHSILQVIEKSSDGVSISGFENLQDDTAYVLISNHRDIILDSSLLNIKLYENNKIMTASAIGDNLIKKNFQEMLSKLNRNFTIHRDLSPRQLLESSKLVSEYIGHLILEKNRSVWIAQKEGRTKNGWDTTHQGVLKMIGMSAEEDVMDYFKKIKIVPVSISYEYDPTDKLKIPQLLAEQDNMKYQKYKNEDFINILSGILGQKKRIHIHIDKPLNSEIDWIKDNIVGINKQIQYFASVIDQKIVGNYALWQTNYIAYDILHNTNKYADKYTEEEKKLFIRRMELRIDVSDAKQVDIFLRMYANPIIHKYVVNSSEV